LKDIALRQIGTLPEEREARYLADHLLTLGVTTQLRPESGGWGVWVLDENRLPQARQEFEDYRNRPDDMRFRAAARTAETIRREAKRIEAEHRKNSRKVTDTWDRTPFRRRPLTVILVALSVFVFLLLQRPRTRAIVIDKLAFTSPIPKVDVQGQERPDPLGIDDIAHGELWRLITPIFLHADLPHIVFNMWWLISLGTVIETRRGTKLFAALVVFSAIASNVGEYVYDMKSLGHPVLFGGMSGVNYALFGYVWMKGRHEPEQGMILHPITVQSMLFWLVICMTGAVGDIANAAHVVGIVAGMLFGLARL
jgi:GlpG protein